MGRILVFTRRTMTTFSTQLANDVKRYRQDHHMSQQRLADLVGATRTVIVRLERREGMPRTTTLDAIWALIHPPTEARVARETSPNYAPAEPYLTWLQQLMASDTPYEEKVQSIQESAALELKRLQRRNSA